VRRKCSPTASASSTAADALKEQYDAETLEEAFFAATGRTFEDEKDEDAERGVFA
jgi:hypothetical protein